MLGWAFLGEKSGLDIPKIINSQKQELNPERLSESDLLHILSVDLEQINNLNSLVDGLTLFPDSISLLFFLFD